MKAFINRCFNTEKDLDSLNRKRNYLIAALIFMLIMIASVVVGIAFLNIKSQGVTDITKICLCILACCVCVMFSLLCVCASAVSRELKGIRQRNSTITRYAANLSERAVSDLAATINGQHFIALRGFIPNESAIRKVDDTVLSSDYQVTLFVIGDSPALISRCFSLTNPDEFKDSTYQLNSNVKCEVSVSDFCGIRTGVLRLKGESMHDFCFTENIENTSALISEALQQLKLI